MEESANCREYLKKLREDSGKEEQSFIGLVDRDSTCRQYRIVGRKNGKSRCLQGLSCIKL